MRDISSLQAFFSLLFFLVPFPHSVTSLARQLPDTNETSLGFEERNIMETSVRKLCLVEDEEEGEEEEGEEGSKRRWGRAARSN